MRRPADDRPRVGPAADCSPLTPIFCAAFLVGLILAIAIFMEAMQ